MDIPFTITSRSNTTLSIAEVQQTFIATGYSGPDGNDPKAYSNWLFVWRGGPHVPFPQQPIASAAAEWESTAISGQYSAEEYVVGYCVGPSVTTGTSPATVTYPNLTATATIPPDWNVNKATYFRSSLGVTKVEDGLVAFSYSLPPGINPSHNGAWVALWDGAETPYDPEDPFMEAAPVTATSDSGSVALTGAGTGSGVSIAPSGQYTAALFTSGYSTDPANLVGNKTVAALVTFRTDLR